MKPETMNAVINYLVSKPYMEVVELIEMIKKDFQEAQEEKKEPEAKG